MTKKRNMTYSILFICQKYAKYVKKTYPSIKLNEVLFNLEREQILIYKVHEKTVKKGGFACFLISFIKFKYSDSSLPVRIMKLLHMFVITRLIKFTWTFLVSFVEQ